MGSAAAVLLAVSTCMYCEQEGRRPALSLMTWNVLARPYTRYNQRHHRAFEKVEAPWQTRARFTFAGEEISARATDLVFLQECEAAFFEPEWNQAASKLLQMYDMYPCRHESHPGTAVLVKKMGRAAALTDRPLCIGGTDETGGPSKIATVVAVRVGSRDLSAVSTHFMYGGAAEQRQHHARLLGEGLRGKRVVLGGDFNCQPGEGLDKLEASSFLGGLQRAPLPSGTMTGLSGDFSREECIDHVYVARDLAVLSAVVRRPPMSPWGGSVTRPAQVKAASDHVPVCVELAWR